MLNEATGTRFDEWLQAANLSAGKLFRRVNKNGSAWGDGLTEKAVWHVVRTLAKRVLRGSRLTTFGGHARGFVMLRAANWNRFNFYSGTFRSKLPSATSAASNGFEVP
jgi:hypothetical protein